MTKKGLLTISLLIALLALGAVSVLADDAPTDNMCPMYSEDDETTVMGYCDGRINATDIVQPVAIYYDYETVMGWDDDDECATYKDVVCGIELWEISSESVGQLVLHVGMDVVGPALTSTTDLQLASANGYTVNYSGTGYFWVTAPNGYTFTWKAFKK